MDKITVNVLTISDRCANRMATDKSGQSLVKAIRGGIVKDAVLVSADVVPDSIEDIQKVLKKWCGEKINLILTTGGTGLSERDVTPEATATLVDKVVPGMSGLILSRSLEVTPLAALSRGIAGVRDKSLIVNLPGSEKAAKQCLEAVAPVIPHAVHLITGQVGEVERLHSNMSSKKSGVPVRLGPRETAASAYPCVSVTSAQNMILDEISALKMIVEISYEKACGHVLAEDIIADDFLPPFDVSLKDGYAIKCSEHLNKRELSVVGISSMGKFTPESEIQACECMEVSTGAMIPFGANAVVQIEDVEVKNDGKEIVIHSDVSLKPGQDVRKKGFDFAPGQLVLKRGTKLNASCLGVVAAVGVKTVRVFAKPVVAVISTGDELVDPEEKLEPGKVRDSNKATLMKLLEEEGFETKDCGIVADHPDLLRRAIEKAAETADVVVTSGSMSMGRCDYLKEVLITDFEAKILFGRIWMKPGKPTACGIFKFEGKVKFWFGLPGNPASAFVTTHLLVLPGLRKVMEYQQVLPTRLFDVAVTDRDLYLEERPHYVRAFLTTNGRAFKASVTGNQSSSRILSCVEANCLIELPEAPKEATNEMVAHANALLIGQLYTET